MRSRYTAFILGEESYLLRTWHRSSRPVSVNLDDGPVWTGLEIRSIEAGGPEDEEGAVEFVARYIAGGRPGTLHENSRFLREDGRWYYLDGDIREAAAAGEKVGRNDPCPCGSGRKFKRCCAG
jgi:SEC-C motif-containing protein